MNLLPKTKEQFKSKDYWDQFFRNRKETFEWYGNYGELSTILHKYCKVKDSTLVLGCGNSQLSEDLYDLGYRGLVNIDISDVVIRQMKERNKERRAEMEFIKMDMLNMDFDADKFNVILDKGTLDAIFVNTSAEVISDVNKMFGEIERVLKTNGRYICITLVQEHILDKLLSHFIDGWFIRVHKIEAVDSPLPVFAFIFTKTKFSGQKNDSFPKILEMCLDGSEKIQRVSSTADIKLAIEDLQKYAMIKQSLGKIKPGDIFSLGLWSSCTTDNKEHREPRYTLTVVDSPPSLSQNGLFAIFIVPQGRETDRTFASRDGQTELAATAKFRRLIIASLHRGHKYDDIETIKQELSAKVMELAPEGVTNEKMVPFLSDGGDIGSRDTLHQGNSEINGDYVIEEVEGKEGERRRCLVFLSNPDAIHSQARIKIETKTVKGKKGKTKKKTEVRVDHSYLFDPCHQGIVAGLAFVEGITDQGSSKVGLLVGLGGGCLSMFLHKFYPQIVLHAVEKDPEKVSIAKKWFDCIEDDHLKAFTEDEQGFIKRTSKEDPNSCYHVIIFDIHVRNKAPNSTAAPISLLEPDFLTSVKAILHKQGAVLIINFKYINTEPTRSKILQELQSSFQEVFILKLKESDSEIIFALPEKPSTEMTQDSRVSQIKKSVVELQKCGEKSKSWDEDMDLCYLMDGLQVL